jgi:glutamine amidotransferase
MNLAIVKYNAGNIFSVECALKRLGVEATLTDDPALLRSADKVIFPGVGEAATTMSHLQARGLDGVIRSLRQPVLGICLGMQLMCRHSEEGDAPCLGIFDVDVKRFPAEISSPQSDPLAEDAGPLKVPHMGWNTLTDLRGPLFKGMTAGEYVYFVHSFYVPVNDHTAAVTDYILPFSASLHKDNFYATQFHPEKSGPAGERILRNFLEL